MKYTSLSHPRDVSALDPYFRESADRIAADLRKNGYSEADSVRIAVSMAENYSMMQDWTDYI